MKVIERYEIEYVVPETIEEKKAIQAIIDDFDKNKKRDIDFSKLRRAGTTALKNGYWRK